MGSPPTAPPLLRLPHLQIHRSQPAVDFPRGSLTQELLEFRPHIGQHLRMRLGAGVDAVWLEQAGRGGAIGHWACPSSIPSRSTRPSMAAPIPPRGQNSS